MHEKVLDILFLCLKAKEKGHDVFFTYSPHVNLVEVAIHFDGWKKRTGPDEKYDVYLDKESAEVALINIGNRLVEVLDGQR